MTFEFSDEFIGWIRAHLRIYDRLSARYPDVPSDDAGMRELKDIERDFVGFIRKISEDKKDL